MCVLLYAFTSCVKDKKITTEKDYHASINGELVGIIELYADTSLYLKFQSRGIYDSYCKHIEGKMIQEQNTFRFELDRVSLDDRYGQLSYDTCGYAQISFLLPSLENGEYPVSVKVPNYPDNNGKLLVNVSTGRFEIKMDSSSMIRFPLGTVKEF